MLFCNPGGRSLLLQGVVVKKCGHLQWFKLGIYSFMMVIFSIAGSAKTENSSPNLEELLRHLEKQHSNTKTLAVRFRQKKHFSFMNKPIVSTGFIIFSSPKKIRFDITDPFETTLLDNGRKIERYELIDGKWLPVQFNGGKAIKLVMEQIGQWMQGKFSEQKKLFTLSVSTEDPNTYAFLDLVPRHKQFRQYIEKIRVSISSPPEYDVYRIDIYEPEGDRFALDFVEELVNQDLPKGCFSDPGTAILCKKLFSKVKEEGVPQEDTKH